MNWQVAVVLDTNPEFPDLNTLVRYMPVWAIESQERRNDAGMLRDAAGEFHGSDAFTLFNSGGIVDPITALENVLDTILLHHPGAACLTLFGVSKSQELTEILQIYDFEPADATSWGGCNFRKPIGKLSNVTKFVFDAVTWKTTDDVWEAFFAAVGAPPWHGKNLNAFEDSIITGGINRVEVPYAVAINNFFQIGKGAAETATLLIDFINEKGGQGCPISVTTET